MTDDKTGVAQEVPGGLLDSETVSGIVRKSGIDPARLSAGQLSFPAMPLHLKLFTEVKAPLTFETLKDLYDAYRNVKLLAVRERLQRQPAWIPFIDLLLQRMVAEQSLSAPQSLVADAFPEELNALLTEQVPTRDGKRLSFFHEFTSNVSCSSGCEVLPVPPPTNGPSFLPCATILTQTCRAGAKQ